MPVEASSHGARLVSQFSASLLVFQRTADQGLLRIARAPGTGGDAAERNPRLAHGVAVHAQRGGGEGEGVGFAVADLVAGRGASERARGDADAQDPSDGDSDSARVRSASAATEKRRNPPSSS